jgi:uncharacterized membrane protein YkoI
LHGQVFSLKYIEALNSYRVRLNSPQGQIFSYEQDARTGQLLGFKSLPADAGKSSEGLLSLEALLWKRFGEATFQLLKAELTDSQDKAHYQLDWIQEDTRFHAHFDARDGRLLSHPAES